MKISASPRLMLIATMSGFLLTIIFLWLDELFDLPSLFFGSAKSPINISESIFESVFILLTALATGSLMLILEKNITILNQEKSKILSIISHDVNNAFTGLLLNTHLLHDKANQLDPDNISEIASDINQSAKKVSTLLTNVLQWSKLNAGGIQAHPETIGLQSLIFHNLHLLHTHAESKSLIITNHIEDNIYISADKFMLNSVIQNILNNAIKFTPSHGKIKIECVIDPTTVHVCFSDTGVGISDAELKCIYDVKPGNTRVGTHGEHGTGLGLNICKQFIEMNHGTLSIQSHPGRGSKMCISLPNAISV
jgi:two-component system, sensor histidine kinase and response regulator